MIFQFYLGGYGRDSYRLTLKGNVLSCTNYYGLPMPDQEKLVPIEDGNNDWALVLELLQKAKWQRSYWTPCCDGTQWELEVKAPDLKIKSQGSNSYPDGFETFWYYSIGC